MCRNVDEDDVCHVASVKCEVLSSITVFLAGSKMFLSNCRNVENENLVTLSFSCVVRLHFLVSSASLKSSFRLIWGLIATVWAAS